MIALVGAAALTLAAQGGQTPSDRAGTASPVPSRGTARRRADQRLAYPRRADGATHVAERWAPPVFKVEPEPAPTDTLIQALDAAYRSAPALQAQRYMLRSSDEDYALALAETRATAQIEITGGYTRTDPGERTDAQRSPLDRLASPSITDNSLGAQLVVDQPLLTGGRAAADRDVATQAIAAGRAQLRGVEGDLFLQVVTVYADIRRDTRVLTLRDANLKQLTATLDEVRARQEAGELTRTDIAQTETQYDVAATQFNATSEQLEQDRAGYAALVGRNPGVLAPEPNLPQFPATVEHAFDVAARLNPELQQAIATERTSRGRIAAAAAEGQPRLSLRGTATVTGRVSPLRSRDEDRGFAGQAVLTVPLVNGGRVGALVAQARDRNAADRIGIEAVRRQTVQAIVAAWNAVAIAQRNLVIQTAQLTSARVYDEGTFEEYRAGLRSTFDVLFAHAALRDAEIALVASRRDAYVAGATLLRRIGMLEARSLLTGTPLYGPAENLRTAAGRGAQPLDSVTRAIDAVGRRTPAQGGIVQPALPLSAPAVAPALPVPPIAPTGRSPVVPLPGTTGVPRPSVSLKHP